MKKSFMIKKGFVVGFIILFVSVTCIPPIIAQTNDTVTICITAGFLFNQHYDKPNSLSIGKGVMIYVVNNLSEPIWIVYQFDYSSLSGEPLDTLRFVGEFPYGLPPDNYTSGAFSNFIQLPCRITVSVEIGSFETGGITTVTRSGYQFHRWLFFPKVTEQVRFNEL